MNHSDMLTSTYRYQTLLSLEHGHIDPMCSSLALNAVHLDASDIRNWEVFAMKSLFNYVFQKNDVSCRFILIHQNLKKK